MIPPDWTPLGWDEDGAKGPEECAEDEADFSAAAAAPTEFKCCVCEQTFELVALLMEHMKSAHTMYDGIVIDQGGGGGSRAQVRRAAFRARVARSCSAAATSCSATARRRTSSTEDSRAQSAITRSKQTPGT